MQEKQAHDKKFVDEHIHAAINSCFFGEISIRFENGRVVLINKHQCFKPKNK